LKVVGLVEIGRVVSVNARRNSLTIKPFTDFPERFRGMTSLRLYGKDDIQIEVRVKAVSIRDSLVVVEVDGAYDLFALKGMYVRVNRDEVFELPEDTFYVFDIIGCEVFLVSGEFVGEIIDVIRTGSNDVYQVRREGKRDLFVPALKDVVLRVDLGHRRVYVDLPEGLTDIYED